MVLCSLFLLVGCGADQNAAIKGIEDGGGKVTLSQTGEVEAIRIEDNAQVAVLYLRNFPNLHELEVSIAATNSEFLDNEMKEIARLQNLKKLMLVGTSITDQGMQSLRQLPQLKRFELESGHVSGAGVSELGGLENLESVQLTLRHCSRSAIQQISNLPHLRRLELNGIAFADELFRGIGGFKKLEHLTLCFTSVEDASIAELVRGANLQSLNLLGTRVTGDFLEDTSQLASLRSLELCSSEWSETGTVNLLKLTSLRELNLSGNRGMDREKDVDILLSKIAGHLQLQKITLRGAVGNRGLEALSKMPELESVHLTAPNASSAGLASLSQLHSLKDLIVFDGTGLDDECVGTFERLPLLERLSIMEAPLTDSCAKRLGQLSKLKRLFISGSRITVTASDQLQRVLPECVVEIY